MYVRTVAREKTMVKTVVNMLYEIQWMFTKILLILKFFKRCMNLTPGFLWANNLFKHTEHWTFVPELEKHHKILIEGKFCLGCIFPALSTCNLIYFKSKYRSSHPKVFCEKGVLRNSAKFAGQHLCQSLFFNKVTGLRPQFLRTPFFTEIIIPILVYDLGNAALPFR